MDDSRIIPRIFPEVKLCDKMDVRLSEPVNSSPIIPNTLSARSGRC